MKLAIGHLLRATYFVATVSLFITALPDPASAQSRREIMESLQATAADLRQDIASLQSQIDAGDDDRIALRELLADMQIRAGQLDTTIRLLTGEVESLEMRLNSMEREFELFRSDVELRFSDLNNPDSEDDFEDLSINSTESIEGSDASAAAVDIPDSQPVAPVGVDADVLEDDGGPGVLPDGTEVEQYDYAFGFMMRGEYASAETAFNNFLEANPDGDLASNAKYWLAESFYVRRDFGRALAGFLEGYEAYPNSNKGPDYLLKLGLTLMNLDETAEACSAFRELSIRFPQADPALRTRARETAAELGCS